MTRCWATALVLALCLVVPVLAGEPGSPGAEREPGEGGGEGAGYRLPDPGPASGPNGYLLEHARLSLPGYRAPSEVHHEKARELEARGEYEKAVEAYEYALSVDRWDQISHEILNDLGRLHWRHGRLKEAAHCFGEAHRRRPRDGEARRNLDLVWNELTRKNTDQLFARTTGLGLRYLDEGRAERAVEVLEQAVKLRPDHAWTHYHLGVAQERSGLAFDARASFEKALVLDPTDPFGARARLAADPAGPGAAAPSLEMPGPGSPLDRLPASPLDLLRERLEEIRRLREDPR